MAVTGAAGDIGRSVVEQLVAEGAIVTAVDRDRDALLDLPSYDGPGCLHRAVGDVTNEADVIRVLDAAVRHGGGRLDALHNNAASQGPVMPIGDVSLHDFSRLLEVNVLGVFLGIKHAQSRLVRGGVIVNTGSTAAFRGSAHVVAYVASKHAVLGLTRSAALELGPLGIRVHALCPGPLRGRMMRAIDQGRARSGGTAGDDEDYGSVEDVASAVLHLMSDEAASIAGCVHVVDSAGRRHMRSEDG